MEGNTIALRKTQFNKQIQEALKSVDLDRLPGHVGIIMDGNGRWAQKRGLARSFGHRAGMENVKTIIRFSSDIGLNALTLFAFSTENWKRPNDEVSLLMSLLLEYLKREIRELHENNVQLNTIGDISKLPRDVLQAVVDAKEMTGRNTGLKVYIGLNYGSRAEIAKATREIAGDVKAGKLDIEAIDEKLISSYLYTCGTDDPDLIIRTSGEMRVSNFMLYQSAYAEYNFTETYWPDFNEVAFIKTLVDYESRQRRYGGI